MLRLEKCIHFYIGCQTNKGQLIGVKQELLLIRSTNHPDILDFHFDMLGKSIFLYLRQLNDLTDEQSKELIKKGIAIGRPNGYTFSNEGFLYLISLQVDLFGLIAAGYAKHVSDSFEP